MNYFKAKVKDSESDQTILITNHGAQFQGVALGISRCCLLRLKCEVCVRSILYIFLCQAPVIGNEVNGIHVYRILRRTPGDQTKKKWYDIFVKFENCVVSDARRLFRKALK